MVAGLKALVHEVRGAFLKGVVFNLCEGAVGVFILRFGLQGLGCCRATTN